MERAVCFFLPVSRTPVDHMFSYLTPRKLLTPLKTLAVGTPERSNTAGLYGMAQSDIENHSTMVDKIEIKWLLGMPLQRSRWSLFKVKSQTTSPRFRFKHNSL